MSYQSVDDVNADLDALEKYLKDTIKDKTGLKVKGFLTYDLKGDDLVGQFTPENSENSDEIYEFTITDSGFKCKLVR